MINKFYHYYQIKSKVLQRFKFILKKDIESNYKIIVDVMYLDKKLVLQALDIATAF